MGFDKGKKNIQLRLRFQKLKVYSAFRYKRIQMEASVNHDNGVPLPRIVIYNAYHIPVFDPLYRTHHSDRG